MFRAADGPLAQALAERAGGRLHLAGHLRAESWNGSTSASFCIVDGARA
jgi:single-stranded-DNA-specific exonuclease